MGAAHELDAILSPPGWLGVAQGTVLTDQRLHTHRVTPLNGLQQRRLPVPVFSLNFDAAIDESGHRLSNDAKIRAGRQGLQ